MAKEPSWAGVPHIQRYFHVAGAQVEEISGGNGKEREGLEPPSGWAGDESNKLCSEARRLASQEPQDGCPRLVEN